ncbi:MAG: C1 family peptidase [Eubacteriales bacterium]|nr:C1 family peptidase [Eubacteriales bacterium]
MKKRNITALILAFCLAASGCGGGSDSEDYNETVNETEAQAEAAASEQAVAALQGSGNNYKSISSLSAPTGEGYGDYSWAQAVTDYLEATYQQADGSQLIDGLTALAALGDSMEVAPDIVDSDMDIFGTFPEKFDLRDYGLVTPVKNQSPWGSCWGFAAIAAAESSILSNMGRTYDETGLDLSEHQLAYFAYTHLPDDDGPQGGEGIYVVNDKGLDFGGVASHAASLFAMGIGATHESVFPYKGRKGIADYDEMCYSKDDDWTLDEEDRYVCDYELQNARMIKSPAVTDMEGNYTGYSQYATNCIKHELMNGRAVDISFEADHFAPDGSGEKDALNMNYETCAHYTYETTGANHAVCIVGWDDTIPVDMFRDHTDDEGGDGKAHLPEGPGAWIVKNSWGAETEEFPNWGDFGILNDEGLSTGYFYLSYYDHSLDNPESFEFVLVDSDAEEFNIAQYDFMPEADGTKTIYMPEELRTANVFTADDDLLIRNIMCRTSQEETVVRYDLYMLNDGAISPEDGELLYGVYEVYDYAGYHRLTLDEPVKMKKGQRFSVVITEGRLYDDGRVLFETVLPYQYDYQTLKDFADETGGSFDYYYKGIINPGESFIYVKDYNAWADFKDVAKAINDNSEDDKMEFDNFPIKVFSEYDD